MEAETLAYWCHCASRADNADLMLLFASQLHEAKEEQAGNRRRHFEDQALTQRIIDLTELGGIVAEAWRAQRPAPLDPYNLNRLTWQ